MTTNLNRLTGLVLAAGVFGGAVSRLAAVDGGFPAASTEAVVDMAAGQIMLRLSDPANRTWVLESSASMAAADWVAIGTWKPHNGRLAGGLPLDRAAGARFFRFVHDPAVVPVASTLANALRLPAAYANYASPVLPPYFLVNPIAAQDNTPANNRITDPAATLGRVLFYDKRLSRNQTVSCASCHQQEHGFSDPERFSTGFAGGLTGRNSMGLANAGYYLRGSFFWDERAATLESQVLQPIQDELEMGMTLPELRERLAAEPFYQSLFTSAFGTATVSDTRISRALAQFVRSIISTQTKYDAGVASGFVNFTPQENAGRQIFNSPMQGNCVACHGTDNFVPGNNI